MRKNLQNTTLSLLALLLSFTAVFAQTKVSGNVFDSNTKEPLIGVSVQLKGKVTGTITDTKGNFSFTTSSTPPFAITVSSVGYKTQELQFDGKSALKVSLDEQVIMGQEVVVAASRVEENVMKSPVTVEKMDIRAIQNAPAASFYDALGSMKGIDLATQSLLFKSINMRGFGATGNPRTVQLIDGMDNSAPGLNFPVDNIVGMPELDVESVEVLPGAASALYGPNALNGLVLMNSKSPFLYQGLSANVKMGVMSSENRPTPTTGYYDMAIRYAKAINNKFAFKLNFGYIKAKDWQSTNYDNLNLGGSYNIATGLGSKTDYDAVNVYGDEVQQNMIAVANDMIKNKILPASVLGLIPNANINRTGFVENALVSNDVSSFKFNGGVHYRVTEKVELVAQLNYGLGTTVYTGTGKYSLRDFSLTQAKIELRGDNFTLRAYTTQESSGKSFTAGLMSVAMLNEIKPHATWYGTYVGGYVAARGAGQADDLAHAAGRSAANAGMPAPGSAAFNTLLDKYSSTSISKGGGAFEDRSALYHAEGVYNLKNQVKFMDLLVGANVRQYVLKSNATLFADDQDGRNGSIPINEYGAFVQGAKSLFGDHLKLTASMRYDKSQNFEGQFSPRVSAVASFGTSSFRASYQTGFRIPTTQNQYISLSVPSARLIGALPEFNKRYNLEAGVSLPVVTDFRKNPLKYLTPDVLAKAQAYATAAVTAQLPLIQAGVTAAVQQQVTAAVTAQVNAEVAAGNRLAATAAAAIAAGVAAQMAAPATQATIAAGVQGELVKQVTAVTTQVAPAFGLAALPKYKAKAFVPEKVKSIEVGYKGLIGGKLFVDASYYNSVYQNFIGSSVVLVPTAAAGPGLPIESGLSSGSTRQAYSMPANSNEDITVTGWSLGLDMPLSKGFSVGANYGRNVLKNFVETPEIQFASFNTPKNRFNISFGKKISSGNKFGFNINYKNQDEFVWEAGFVVPTTVDIKPYTNTLVPSVSNIDAQVSYKLSSMKSILKVGGTNILGTPYIQAYGSPSIGSMYYVSISFDELLNK
jgi:iron complex outermembrane recepter protein